MDNYNGFNNGENQNNQPEENNNSQIDNNLNAQQNTYESSSYEQQENNSQFNDNNQQTGYNYGYNYNNGANMNEFSYQPPKKKKGKKLVVAMVSIACVAAIGATAVVGYSIMSGKNIKLSGNGNEYSQSSGDTNANKTSAKKRENLPTLVQLATPDDAMKIPDIVKKVSPSVVGISCMTNSGTATGTGVVMSSDGYIVTNAHVVDGANAISVLLPSDNAKSDDSSKSDAQKITQSDSSKNLVEAELIGQDSQTDIAVLKINKKNLTAVEFGKSSEIQVGEVSIVIGNPLGFNLANSVTAGIISATDRSLTIEDRTMNLIQTDASINSGNSGGPLINAYGQVIGITSAKVASTYGEGLGFAIPIDEALPIVKDLMENGYVKGRPTLGVSGTNVSDVQSQFYDVPKGFIVKSVEQGSAAEKAGIKENDIIVGIEDTLIKSIEEFNSIKEKYKAGDKITVSLYRNKKITKVNVTLDEAVDKDTSTQQNQQNQNGNNGSNGFGDFGNGFGNFGY